MKITLVRHGRSLWTNNSLVTVREFQEWVKQYDAHGVFEEAAYPPETVAIIQEAAVLFSSDLKRATESAAYLHPGAAARVDPLFREAALPVLPVSDRRIKLRARTWTVLARSVWLCGYSRECESLLEAKQRAGQAALCLIKSAGEHHHVVLVGHGVFNRLIGKELRKRGWTGKRQTSAKHWNATTYMV